MLGGGLNRTVKPMTFISMHSKEAGEGTWRSSVSMVPPGLSNKNKIGQ